MILRRTKGGYEPADNESAEMALKHKAGDLVECTITKKRNIKFHRKFFAMVSLVMRNQEKIQYSTTKQGQERLLYAAMYILKRGSFWGPEKQHFERDSISFANMSEDDFADFYSEVLDVFLMYFVQVGTAEFERELLNFG
jgi:hypothetical protein